MGSFWAARFMASRANDSSTPLISNITRPGLTTATYASGVPLPLPMRVSAGFLVTGLWGKMLIQTFPPRRIFLVIAIRAASIWRLVIQAGSNACSPNSPNCTSVPPLAWPRILPLWGFLYLSFLGTSISLPPHRFGKLVVDAVVDPDLDPDLAHLRLGLLEAVIYVRIERVERNSPLGNGLRPAHLDATEPAATLNPRALGATTNGAGESPLHGPPERGPSHELLGDGLGDEAGVELRTGDFPYVDLHLLAGEALELAAQGVDLATALADHDAWPRGVDVHRDLTLFGGLADLDVRYARPGELLLDVLPDLEVLTEELGVVPVRVPTALEIYLLAPALHAETEAFWMYFLAHLFLLVSGRAHQDAGRCPELDADVAGAFADHGRAAHSPRAVALDGRAVVHPAVLHEQLVGVRVVVVLRVGGRALDHLGDDLRRPLVGELQQRDGLEVALAPDLVCHQPRLARGDADVFGLRLHRRLAIRSPLTCVRNVRVGANSPSLWPTIDSVQYTGTCLRPSCTAMVWPTISGKIVDVRDQVRIMVLVLALFMSSMRRMRRSSTNGPFLEERDISVHPSCRGGGLGRCSGRTPCASCGCGSRSSARPTASADGCPAAWRPRRRRADGRRGSWPCRASAGGRPCGACGRPCRS